jgi:hypothetical protein
MEEAHEKLEKKVDDEVASLNASIDAVESRLEGHEEVMAGLNSAGHVQLSNAITSESQTVAATSKAVKDAHDQALASAKAYADSKFGTVAEAMNFKGSATISELETKLNSAANGDTYKVTSAGTLGGEKVEVGDMAIAHVENGERNWIVVQANIDGAVTADDTLTKGHLIVGDGSRDVKAFDGGSSGQVLKSTGSGIEWADEVKTREIKADGKTVVAAGTDTALNIAAGDNVEISINNGTITIGAEDTTYEAGKGISISDANEIAIKQATSSELGGIKIGHTSSGNEYGVQLDSNGAAYVTVDATISAGTGIAVDGRTVGLESYGSAGTAGVNTNTSETLSIVIPKIEVDAYGRAKVSDQSVTIKDTTYGIAGEDLGLVKASKVSTDAVVAPTSGENRAVQVNSDGTAFVNVGNIVAAGTGVSVSGNTVSIKAANETALGGIRVYGVSKESVEVENPNARVGTVASGGSYGVNVDKDGKAFVNVPWVNSWRDVKVAGDSINSADLEFGADFALNNGKVELTWYTI